MNVEAMHAARVLAQRGVEVEIIDPRSIAPLDEEIIIQSVEKTRRCIVADIDWAFSGFSAELAALIAEKCFGVETVFTPVPVDFKKWVEIQPDELWGMPETKLLRETLLSRQPMAVLRDRARMAPNQ